METQPIKLFKKILKQLINDLEGIQNTKVEEFNDAVIDAFDGYHYEGEEDVVGIDKWPDLSKDGSYELTAKVNHEDAYELTIYITSNNGNISVTNVL
jgi:hypothetical protein